MASLNRAVSSDASDAGHPLDFAALEDLDPSLIDGFRLIYEREVPFEVRNHHGDEQLRQGTLELIRVKIVIAGAEDNPDAVRMELSSEADLFFHYSHQLDNTGFAKVQEAQKIMVDLADYPTILVRMLNSCIKEPHIHLGILTIHNDSEARLDFIQNMQYKFVELMYCACERTTDDIVQQHITFRYNAMKQKLSSTQNRLHEITNLVKIKNPSLLLQLQKVSAALTASGSSGASTAGAGIASNPPLPPNAAHNTSSFGSTGKLK